MLILRLDDRYSAATHIQAVFRGYTIRCLRFAPDYNQYVAYSQFLTVDCDTDYLLNESVQGFYYIYI